MKSIFVLLASVSWSLLMGGHSFAENVTLPDTAINGTTIAIVCVDSRKFELSPKLLSLLKTGAFAESEEVFAAIEKTVSETKELMQGEKGYLAFDLPYNSRPQGRLITPSKVPEANLLSLTQAWPLASGKPTNVNGWRILGLSSSKEGLSTPPIQTSWIVPQDTFWESAMEATSDAPVQFIIVPPSYFRKTIVELDSELPAVFGGGPAKTLLAGVDWVSLGLDPKSLQLKVIVQADSVETAQAVKSHLPKLLSSLAAAASLDKASSIMLQAVLDLMQPKVENSQVILSLQGEQSDSLLQMATLVIKAAAPPFAASKTETKMKQFVLGVHSYYDAHRHLPTYHKMEQQKGLSWRVHILPFIEQGNLYQEFHLDEAWDSPHNLRLLDRMPDLYKPVIPPGSTETVKPFHTTYVAPVGKDTVFGQDKMVGFEHVTDGTSNTVLFVEVKPEHAIPWTSPEELRFDPAAPATQLRSLRDRVTIALMDGSVQQVRVNQPASFWNAVFSRNGSEIVTIE